MIAHPVMFGISIVLYVVLVVVLVYMANGGARKLSVRQNDIAYTAWFLGCILVVYLFVKGVG